MLRTLKRHIFLGFALLCGVVLLVANGALAQSINFSSSRYDSHAQKATIFQRETTRLERMLTRRFPMQTLRYASKAKGTPVLQKATYETVYHGGVKYLVAIYTARWEEPVNQIHIYAMSGSRAGERVWRSRSWTSSYYGVQLSQLKVGYRTLLLFKEGGLSSGEFGIASVFSLSRYKGKVWIRDHTPVNPVLSIKTSFPFRALYGQNIGLEARTFPTSNIVLTANDRMYRFQDNYVQQKFAWSFDKGRARFVPLEEPATMTMSN